MLHRTAPLLALALIALLNIGCAATPHTPSAAPTNRAIAVLTPTDGNQTAGAVNFTQTDEGVRITAQFENLTPGDHGFHIHQWGDISLGNGKAAGGHFNPAHQQHGARNADHRHVGDLGNLTADATGAAHYDWTDPHMDLALIIGRGVIVHAKRDDYGQPTGNAGARVAQGVIGVAKGDDDD